MSRNRELLTKRNESIKKDYQEHKQLRKFTSEYIFCRLSDKYYLSVNTIQAVVFGSYERKTLA